VDLIRRIELVSATRSTVLITGETGTGKELVARAIHNCSARGLLPFIKVNCAAIPETLLESEMFGHVRGAFTSATGTKKGKFALAHRGSIFLDEIGTMNITLQAKLLRVLQEREIEPLGAERSEHVDVRVIAATNRDLRQLVDQGRFQDDLFYRLHVIPIEVPPLRERVDDIPMLVAHFAGKYATRCGKLVDSVDEGVMSTLMAYGWPGNIRELENAIERAMLLAERSHIAVEDLRLGDSSATGTAREASSIVKIPPTGIPLEEIERLALVEALKMSNWVQKDAAELLAISPRVMNYKIKTLGIDFPRGRRAQAAVAQHETSGAAMV
jgi:two-component system NtrC family response regulator